MPNFDPIPLNCAMAALRRALGIRPPTRGVPPLLLTFARIMDCAR